MFKNKNGINYFVPFLLIATLYLLWGLAHGLLDVLNKFAEEHHGERSYNMPHILGVEFEDSYSHCFYTFGNEGTKFVLGPTAVYDGAIYANFTRDGSWQEFDIPMSTYAAALATTPCVAGVNVFVALTEGVVGAQLNLDAVYFYKK